MDVDQKEGLLPQFDSRGFLAALCKYYMEFLETDFHRRRRPSRRFQSRDTKKGLVTGIRLNKYDGLTLQAIRLLASNFSENKDKFSGLKQGEVVRYFPSTVVEAVSGLWRDDSAPDVEVILEVVREYLRGHEDLDWDYIIDALKAKLADYDLEQPESRKSVMSFLQKFPIADFYQDIYQIWKSKGVLDKQDVYFYFYDIRYDGESYPLFYVPVTVAREPGGVFQFEYDPRLFINTRAVQYITERFAEATDSKVRITLPPRHIYRGELSANELLEALQNTLNEITDFFGLEKLDVTSVERQVGKNVHVQITSDVNIALFDKSDEALLNDYEHLLQMLQEGDESDAVGLLEQLSNAFLLENPQTFSREIDEVYNELDSGQRLSYVSPIPLNEEQLKVLSALKKDGCDRVIIDGPPGTGKSHTITALIYNALLQSQSVLMVSDTREALDVVEKEITKVLDKMRLDDFIQNPILRLGVKDSNFHKIFSPANFQKIRTRYNAYQRHRNQHERDVKEAVEGISKSINGEVEAHKKVDYQHVAWLVRADLPLEEHWGRKVDLEELLQTGQSGELILHLHEQLKRYAEHEKEIRAYSQSVELQNFPLTDESMKSVATLAEQVDRLNSLLDQLGAEVPKTVAAIAKVSGSTFPRSDFSNVESTFYKVAEKIGGQEVIWKRFVTTDIGPDDLLEVYDEARHIVTVLSKLRELIEQQFTGGQKLVCAADLTEKKLRRLEAMVAELKERRRPVIGYLMQSKKLEGFDTEFKRLFPVAGIERPSKSLPQLEVEIAFYNYASELKPKLESLQFINSSLFEWEHLYRLSAGKELEAMNNLVTDLSDQVESLRSQLAKVQASAFVKEAVGELGMSASGSYTLLTHLAAADEYVHLVHTVRSSLHRLRLDNFIESKKEPLTYHLEARSNSDLRERLQGLHNLLKTLKKNQDGLELIKRYVAVIPNSAGKLGIDVNDFSTLPKNKLVAAEEDQVKFLVGYLQASESVTESLAGLGVYNFRGGRQRLQDLLTAKMSSILDEKVIEFREQHRNDAQELKKIIRGKQQIPKEYLTKLVTAFPCLIVGIRELGDYIPLEPGIFDLVIIDEASQVSIAQAFPAILRGKKVVVLGDPKQYSNVKSAHASTAINNQLFAAVREAYDKAISDLPDSKRDALRNKIDRFTIKNSILEFLRNIVNYEALLKKHFRGYPEIIGYSNEMFYQGALQVMKIRGKPISEVIQFHYVEPGDVEEIDNTNEAEIDYIFDQLLQLKEQGFDGTVGIITPFRNQHARLAERFYSSDQWSYFDEKFKLKIMTFDTCQGEQRDIIYYSMVEKPGQNTLRYIFPVNLQRVEDEEDGNLKAQRLNVGLSRAAESVRFVMSKKVSEVRSEMGKALQWYNNELQRAAEEPDAEECESPAEKLLLSLIKQTPFYKEERDNIEIKTQFELGKYLKQLNPALDIPKYRVDFLMTYTYPNKSTKTVVVEYDGFEYHFQESDAVAEWNIDEHYIDEDVERQKTLESYGYDFVRFNKFTLRGDAVAKIDKELKETFKKKLLSRAPIPELYDSYVGLQSGDLRQCPKCMEIRDKKDFYDRDLSTKYGRTCMYCKGKKWRTLKKSRTKPSKAIKAEDINTSVACPKCRRPMVLRTGPYGQFMGCSSFPYCRGTRRIIR